MAYAALPAYKVGNAMNFEPLNQALDSYQAGAKLAGESSAKIAAANAMAAGDYTKAASELTKVDPMAALAFKMQPYKEQEAQNSIEQSTRSLLGGTAEALAAIQDPTQRQATAQKIFASDPRWKAGADKLGIDVNNTDAMIAAIRAEALGPINQTAKAAQEAQTARNLVVQTEPGVTLHGLTPQPAAGGATMAPPSTTPLVRGGLTNKTMEDRQAMAGAMGLQPGTPKYEAWVLNGKDPTSDLSPRETQIVDANQKQIQAMEILKGKLNDAKQYSSQAYQGFTAPWFAGIVQATPWLPWGEQRQAANATKQMDIITQGQALGQAKNDAGSRVTAYLERVEQRLRAEPNMPDVTRQELLDKAMQYIDQNLNFTRAQTDAIINRTNFKPPGAQGYAPGPTGNRQVYIPSEPQSGPATGPTVQGKNAGQLPQGAIPEGQPGSRTSPVYPRTPEDAAQLPSGTYFLTPDGRLKVRP